MKQRLSPFLMLLDARYLPLLFAASYQAYTVYRWLWQDSAHTTADKVFAILGGLAFEAVYVGCIAWSEQDASVFWMRLTTGTALVFSVAVAIHMYWAAQQWASLLHAGFPIVAFCYAQTMHGRLASPAMPPAIQHAPVITDLPTLAAVQQPVAALPEPVADDAQPWQDRAVELRQAGRTWQEISSEVNKSVGSVRNAVAKAGAV